jgi:hypothetical protein
MTKMDDDDELTDKRICHACISEEYPAAEIKALARPAPAHIAAKPGRP